MTTTPSFELGPDHLELRDWVHTFAADVIRPAAAEWDEREEFPWPVLEEAAKVGLYSLDFFATQSFEKTGLGIPVAMEELFWGDAGIGLSIVGTALAAAGLRRERHRRAGRRVGTADVRRAGRPQGRGVLLLRARRRK